MFLFMTEVVEEDEDDLSSSDDEPLVAKKSKGPPTVSYLYTNIRYHNSFCILNLPLKYFSSLFADLETKFV